MRRPARARTRCAAISRMSPWDERRGEPGRDPLQTKAFFDAIVDNVPHVVFVKEARGLRFTRVNRAAAALLELPPEAIVGKTARDLFPEARARALEAHDREVLAGRVAVDVPEESIPTNGGPRWLHTTKIPLFAEDGTAAFVVGISEDITEQRELRARLRQVHEELEQRVMGRTAQLLVSSEELQREIRERKQAEAALRTSEDQLRHAQKMEAIGRLAGGVAHDFNNLLSVIMGYAQVMLGSLPLTDPMHDHVQEIFAAGTRASQLTKQLLAFGRKQVLRLRVLDLNEIIQDTARMLKRIIGEDVDLLLVTEPDLALARLDPTQVEQVLLNLVVNARDAMPHGGKLTIETRNVTLDEAFARTHLGVLPGRFVMLSVSDTGVGMDAATQARVFEPFFTTKETGRGTGLGLSTVFGIVEQSGGTIWVDSAVGRGTRFTIYFPVTDAEGEPMQGPKVRTPRRGDETVLLVEDDPQVRALVRSLLAREGYAVLEAASASEALAVSGRFLGTIHLLVTDVVMPKTSGPELARALATARPRMKVLFISGYDDAARHAVLPEGAALVQKPLVAIDLAQSLRDVLDG